jgi:hypothetical protein
VNRNSLRGNGNRAIWQHVTLLDGGLYRLPNGELVMANVDPHPVSNPEYWKEFPDGSDAYSVGEGLTLSVIWPEDGGVARGTEGTARLTFLTAGCVAGVPWATGYFVDELALCPRVMGEDRENSEGVRTGWTVNQLVGAGPEGAIEFAQAVQRAERARERLEVVKELMARERYA